MFTILFFVQSEQRRLPLPLRALVPLHATVLISYTLLLSTQHFHWNCIQ